MQNTAEAKGRKPKANTEYSRTLNAKRSTRKTNTYNAAEGQSKYKYSLTPN